LQSPVQVDTNIVEIDNLSFAYDKRPILHGINMRISRGKVVAIMGSSGCGKTTLLRVIGGAVRPTAGSTRVMGKGHVQAGSAGLFEIRRRMGMLFQFGALFTDMSVFENVAFPMREHARLPEGMIRDLVMMKLDAVGLRGVAQLMPSALSGGMARRVALAARGRIGPDIDHV
jgi:phospholipid/cholesterol/gamma-HCH transport system ATP-binding protein